ncbi:hypothetical protein HJ796_000990 [Escherichia coli]|uniref:hypothetical protein n=1 Tax=Escherichia coli TaxID=562 RepID=UPI00053060EC|nr:hypothetical protein [Escherichia coli]EEZ0490824.1 hypothetical protein [Escherichia coli]EKV4690397.1 hypothetical protein [Escherichia coli]EKY1557996.1 hypothetical protein [Escherichia coli]MDF6980525.1 hypothetical protein [Escherichia coli]HAS0000802.1 hypothetical protein [Escherichia coli]
MESNIKGLVSAGHEMASELKAECGAVDMRSVAKLISDLATQLEVQLVRANALAEDHQRAIESIKQADSAVKLAHENFSALAAENAGLKDYLAPIGLKVEGTPTTDAVLAEIERKAIRKFINSIEHILRDKLSPYDTEEMLEAMRIFLEEQGGEQKWQ